MEVPQANPLSDGDGEWRLAVRDVGIDPALPRALRWEFELRRHQEQPLLIVARTGRTGVLYDLQQLGPAPVNWPSELREVVSERVREEIVRAKLPAILAKLDRDRSRRRAA